MQRNRRSSAPDLAGAPLCYLTPVTRRAALAALTAAGLLPAQAPVLDRFGGLQGIRSEPGPWFRLAQMDGRWLFVTPQGSGHIALGVNHISALDRAGAWQPSRAEVLAQLRGWNMTNLGYAAPGDLHGRMPYFATITTAFTEKHRSLPAPHHADGYLFPDVFDPAWQSSVDRRIAEGSAAHRDNPFCVGYMWTDTPTWDLVKTRGLRGTDWVSAIRALPAASPGKKRYARFLAQRYAGRLAELNSLYGLSVDSLEELAATDFAHIAVGRHVVAEDDRSFLGQIARQYYRTVGESQRKHDPNHLILGERYLAGDAPANVLRAATPHIDAVAVQPGDRYSKLYPPSTRYPEAEIERLHSLTAKPVLICDHAISYPTPEQPKTIFEQVENERAAAEASARFVRQAMAKPYMVGYLRCQYVDRPSGRGRGLRQGLVTADGKPRKLLVEAYREVFADWLAGV